MKYVGRGYVDGGATAAAAAAIAAALALAVIHRIRLIMVVISRIMVAGGIDPILSKQIGF